MFRCTSVIVRDFGDECAMFNVRVESSAHGVGCHGRSDRFGRLTILGLVWREKSSRGKRSLIRHVVDEAADPFFVGRFEIVVEVSWIGFWSNWCNFGCWGGLAELG